MKKLLTILGSIGLMTGAALPMMSFTTDTQRVAEAMTTITRNDGLYETWSASVWANATNGDESVHPKDVDIPLSSWAPDYDTISRSMKYINVHGDFWWGTYKNPVEKTFMSITEETPSTADEIIFTHYEQHNASNGFGNQQTAIRLTFRIHPDENKLRPDGKRAALLDISMDLGVASQMSAHIVQASVDISAIDIMA